MEPARASISAPDVTVVIENNVNEKDEKDKNDRKE